MLVKIQIKVWIPRMGSTRSTSAEKAMTYPPADCHGNRKCSKNSIKISCRPGGYHCHVKRPGDQLRDPGCNRRTVFCRRCIFYTDAQGPWYNRRQRTRRCQQPTWALGTETSLPPRRLKCVYASGEPYHYHYCILNCGKFLLLLREASKYNHGRKI